MSADLRELWSSADHATAQHPSDSEDRRRAATPAEPAACASVGPLLSTIAGPADLRSLSAGELSQLAAEIRSLLIQTVSHTGGHLGPNLGVVELTIALHRVFDSPSEPILFDVGHQAYVHKILTGRAGRMSSLRQSGGLSGYPSRAESPHDWIENSHASTALSYADGIAKAFALNGVQRPVVAVVGDGALTGGMSWEALNNVAASDRQVVMVLNDNGRAYAPTIGGLAEHLAALRKGDDPPAKGFFENLGLRYVGPVDGHDRQAVEDALTIARQLGGPVVVHCVTSKGHGYPPAEHDVVDRMHQSTAFDVATGIRLPTIGKRWTGVFAQEIAAIGDIRSDVVAVCAAMCDATGLGPFAQRFPDRFYDVGIAEQHALTSAAGLASAGLHPVVTLYATFLNRAFDQLLMDVALHRLPVTVVLDRAGITGEDGPSHNGIWDLALLGMVPGLRLAAPRDGSTLRAELREAVDHAAGPTVVRFPKTALCDDMVAVRRIDGVDVLAEPPDQGHVDVLLIAVGDCAVDALAAAEAVRAAGRSVRVVDPRWVTPVDLALVGLARSASLVVTIEDGVVTGGVGSRISQELRSAGVEVPTREIGIQPQFLPHGSVAELRAAAGLTPMEISSRVLEWCGS